YRKQLQDLKLSIPAKLLLFLEWTCPLVPAPGGPVSATAQVASLAAGSTAAVVEALPAPPVYSEVPVAVSAPVTLVETSAPITAPAVVLPSALVRNALVPSDVGLEDSDDEVIIVTGPSRIPTILDTGASPSSVVIDGDITMLDAPPTRPTGNSRRGRGGGLSRASPRDSRKRAAVANALDTRPKGRPSKALAEVRANAIDPLALFPDHALQRSGKILGLSNEWSKAVLDRAQEYIQNYTSVVAVGEPLREVASDLHMEIIWLTHRLSFAVETITRLRAQYESVQARLGVPLPPLMEVDEAEVVPAS
ncbi:hypothetical protein FA15DRAFT_711810, partial [Coprinopsis marcescibilis]